MNQDSQKRILAVITARGGSKGIPGKNIKELGGKPLISYTIDVAKKSEMITDLIVSTDDEDIARVAREYGADVPFMRPKELAEDSTQHLPVMQHATQFMEDKTGKVYDYVVILHPTSPFRSVDDIDETLKKIIDKNADSAVTLVEMSEHPIKAKRLEGDHVLPFLESLAIDESKGMRRQDLPKAYKRSGALYVTKRDVLMDDDSLYGSYSVGYVVPKERYVDIDEPPDWIMAEVKLQDLKKKGYEF